MSVHYSQETPGLESQIVGDELFVVRASGFVSAEMLRESIDGWRRMLPAVPRSWLVDCRRVTGYASECGRLARGWLHVASPAGLGRVALVAPSAVLRTAGLLLASRLALELRPFENERAALRWLGTRTLTDLRPRPSSQSPATL